MNITTESIKERLPYLIGGAAAGLAIATVIPASVVLATGTLAVCGTLAYKTLVPSHKPAEPAPDETTPESNTATQSEEHKENT